MMKKLFTLFALLLFVPAVFADSSSNFLHPDSVSNFTDLSVNYLSQIFGTVGNVLSGNGSQMMGKLFYVLNNGILLAAVVVIAYSVLMSSIRLASEGVSIAQGKSTLFSLIKLAVGVAIIIPSPSTGYSVLQTIVMKTVIEGVGLADSIWDHGLDYLKDGGIIWADPGNNTKSHAELVTKQTISALYGVESKLATQVFADEVCMYGSRDPSNTTVISGGGVSNAVSADAPTQPAYSVWVNEGMHTFNFPGLADSNPATSFSCGSISWNIKNACARDANGQVSANCATARQAVSSLVMGLLPLAQKYYCSNVNNGSSVCSDVSLPSNDYANSVLFNSMLSYYSSMNVFANQQMNKASVSEKKKAFIDGAKAEGWLNAGRYYWDLMQFTGNTDSGGDVATYIGQANSPDSDKLAKFSNLQSIVNSAANKISGTSDSYVLDSSGNITNSFQDYINSVYGQAGQNGPGSSAIGGKDIFSKGARGVVAVTYINPGVGATLTSAVVGMDLIGHMFRNPDSNPIAFLYKLGQACLKLTIAIWVIGGVTIGGMMMAYGVCQASSPLAVMGQTVASWFTPMISMIAIMLWVSGFFLSYYVPLYPFMMFLFAAIGWFISVIEAMVAAPLVALGLTHPENHDFLGKAEQAVVLLLGVFIQPSLLVIGLIAGIIFSFVSFKLLIYSFSGFILDIMGTNPSNDHSANIVGAAVNSPLYSTSIILTQPLLLIVFCTLTYTLLTQSFSLVFLLRDNVMRWIGAPGSGLASPEQLAQETKGAITGFGKSTGEGQSQGMSGSIKSLGDSGKAIKEEMGDKKASSIQSGDDGGAGGAAGGAAM